MVDGIESGLKIPHDIFNDFLYFDILDGDPKVRIYLNVRTQSMPNMINLIGAYIDRTPGHGITAFKAACPRAAVNRPDSIVLYCIDEPKARAIACHLLRFPTKFKSGVPKLTTPLHPTLGVAMGAQPKAQATGMDFKEDYYQSLRAGGFDKASARNMAEKDQSFGSIRSELMAMAIENYLENHKWVSGGSQFDKLCKFVCCAFRGYGLDPKNPGS